MELDGDVSIWETDWGIKIGVGVTEGNWFMGHNIYRTAEIEFFPKFLTRPRIRLAIARIRRKIKRTEAFREWVKREL